MSKEKDLLGRQRFLALIRSIGVESKIGAN